MSLPPCRHDGPRDGCGWCARVLRSPRHLAAWWPDLAAAARRAAKPRVALGAPQRH